METIEILRNQYYEAIQLLQDEEDIKNAFPQSEFTSFFQIMYGLVEKLSIVEKELIEELNNIDNQDKEMLEYLKEELELNNFNNSLCEKLIKEARKEELFRLLSGEKNGNIIYYDQALSITKKKVKSNKEVRKNNQ